MRKITNANAVEMVTDKFGYAIYEEESKTVAQILEKITRKNGTVWYQQTSYWYLEDLLEDGLIKYNDKDAHKAGLYIDFGADWFVPRKDYRAIQERFVAYLEGGAKIDTNIVKSIMDNEW